MSTVASCINTSECEHGGDCGGEEVNQTATQFTIESVFQELHSGCSDTGPMPIHRYLQKAISTYNCRAVEKILLHYQSIIAVSRGRNNNLPLHDLFETYFNITCDIKRDAKKLALLVKNVKNVMKILIHHGVEAGVHEAGGLLKANNEKIDFVDFRHRTPIQIFLSQFERVLDLYREKPRCISVLFELAQYRPRHTERKPMVLSEEDNALLIDASCCIEYCVETVRKAWEEEGYQDSYTIMHSAITVFPLLQVETLRFLVEKFCCYDKKNHQIGLESRHPLEFRDSSGRSVLMQSVYQATARRQLPWGDWKERFQFLLDKNYNGFRQCWIRDKDSRLPIHIAATRGLAWENGLKELVEIDTATLLEPDPFTGVLPFMAVASRSADLNLTMQFLRMNPAAVTVYTSLKYGGQKRKYKSNPASPARTSKRNRSTGANHRRRSQRLKDASKWQK